MPDVGAAAGFGDGQAADLLAAQGGPHPAVDLPLVAGGDHVRHRDAAGEQRGEHPAGRPGVMHLLADDHGVGAVAAAAADRLGEARAEQPGLAGLAVQFAGQFAAALPLVEVRQDVAFGERAHGLSQLLRARGCARYSRRNSSGMSMMPAAQPFAQPFGLRVEPGLIRHALPEDAVDDEVDRPQIGQHVPGDGQSAVSGSNSRSFSTVRAWASQRHCVIGAHPDADVGVAALVAAAGAGDRARAGRAGCRRTAAARAARTAAPGASSRVCGGRRDVSMRVPSACTATCGTSAAAT